MLRHDSICSVLKNAAPILHQQKRFFYSGLSSTSSSFLEFSKKTEKSDNYEAPPAAPPVPSFFPYHKNHLSTKRFHWKEPVKNMLDELKENGMEPTHRLSNWWSLHDPVESLQKQHQIEYKYTRQIIDDEANHSFQKDAFDNTQEFLLGNNNNNNSSSQSLQNNNNNNTCNEFMDILRFRIKHGVALPSEIAMGRAYGFISAADVEDKEALELATRLAPKLWVSPGMGDWWYFTSALAHGSGIGWNVGKLAAEWLSITDHLPLGVESAFDTTREKILLKAHEATKPKSTPGSPAFYYPKRLAKIQDWTKAHVVFIDLSALSAGASSSSSSQDWHWTYSGWSDATDERLKISNLFGPPGFARSQAASVSAKKETSENSPPVNHAELLNSAFSSSSSPSERDALLNRWHHMLCVPKISTFSLAVSTNFSDLVLESLFKKMSQDPNLIIVFQHAGSATRDPTSFGGQSAASGGLPDMNVIEQVFLRSLPIHGYTTTVGWHGAMSWIEDVLKTELGFPLDTIPVSCVSTRSTKDNWVIEPGTNRLSQLDDGSYRLDEQLLPKCCFDTNYNNTNSLTSIGVDLLSIALIGVDYSGFQNDNSCLIDVWKSKEGLTNFWKGIPMPTTMKQLRNDYDETSKKDLKWWSRESVGYPYHYVEATK